MKGILAVALAILIAVSAVGVVFTYQLSDPPTHQPSAYIGVAFCGNTTAEGKLLADRVQSYTNLYVIDSIVVNKNQTELDELCDYAVSKGLHVMVYFGDFNLDWQLDWVKTTQQRLGDMFLGVYYYDEPGGIQLDYHWYNYTGPVPNHINETRNYDLAAAGFIASFTNYPNFKALKETSIPVFTSDYALYWWDYKAGFDVVLAQLGWNSSVNQQIALTRGAAEEQNKSWGVIVTWTYNQPPYLETGPAIYDQMLTAYQSGAQYILIFNYPTYPEGNPYGVMTDEHFDALQMLWNYATADESGANTQLNSAQAVLVLPRNYAWGLRDPNDLIWGFWRVDDNSAQVWNVTQTLLTLYGARLDIVYDDPAVPIGSSYLKVYYWNQTLT